MSKLSSHSNAYDKRRPHTTETPDVRHIANPDVMHEESDVNVRGVATFVISLFIFGVAVLGLMYGLRQFFEYQAEKNDPKPLPVARRGAELLPPAPRLQSAPGDRSLDDASRSLELKEPGLEWELLKKKYERDLNGDASVDQTGNAKISIEDAKKLLLQKGLPVRPAANGQSPQRDEGVPSYSSSGRQGEMRDK